MTTPNDQGAQSRARLIRAVWGLAGIVVFTGGAALARAQELSQDPGRFDAQAGTKKHRRPQDRPIELGTSGSSPDDFTIDGRFITCCVGTLGALVEKNGELHILSNNHVLARSNLARLGDPVGQPGLVDQQPACRMSAGDFVADLSAYKPIKWGPRKTNRVDAAIARVREGKVDPTGKILRMGVPGKTPVDPVPGMRVQKAGRTSGLTRGTILSIGATALVDFEPRCGSEELRTARFVDQIIVVGDRGSFSRGGDSGSVVYQDVDTCPSPVGLLFAGGELTLGGDTLQASLLNPAKTVLKVVRRRKPRGKVSFVGCDRPTASTASRGRPLLDEGQIGRATRALRRREGELFELPGVHAVGVGFTLTGPVETAIHVFVTADRPDLRAALPTALEGYRVEIIQTARFVAW